MFLIMTSLNAEVVKDIQIEGNKRVSNETIKIYGDIDLNKDYSEKDLNVITNNLYETNFFEDIKIDLNNNVLNKSKRISNNKSIINKRRKSKRYKDQIKK